MKELYEKFLKALGQAEPHLLLNYQHHICKIMEAVDDGDLIYAQSMIEAITTELYKKE